MAVDIAILDFMDGADRIDLSDIGLSFEDLVTRQDGDDVVIELQTVNKTIRLIDFALGDLGKDDFLL